MYYFEIKNTIKINILTKRQSNSQAPNVSDNQNTSQLQRNKDVFKQIFVEKQTPNTKILFSNIVNAPLKERLTASYLMSLLSEQLHPLGICFPQLLSFLN